MYLCAFFSQAPPAEQPASLLGGKSYARSEGDAWVNGTGQRPGQGKARHTSDQLQITDTGIIHPKVYLQASEPVMCMNDANY